MDSGGGHGCLTERRGQETAEARLSEPAVLPLSFPLLLFLCVWRRGRRVVRVCVESILPGRSPTEVDFGLETLEHVRVRVRVRVRV